MLNYENAVLLQQHYYRFAHHKFAGAAELLHVVDEQFKETTVISIAHRLNFIRKSWQWQPSFGLVRRS